MESESSLYHHPWRGPGEWLDYARAFLASASCNSVFSLVNPEPIQAPELTKAGTQILTFITSNSDKAREVQEILEQDQNGGSPWQVVTSRIDLPELQGEPEDVAIAKCKIAARQINGPVIVEDTSLCFNALGGLPGIYIKWFSDALGLELHHLLDNFPDHSAYAQCIFAFSPGPAAEPLIFAGRTNGCIVPPRDRGFGWDPVFSCIDPQLENTPHMGKTFSEMPAAVKHSVSPRQRAIKSLCSYLHVNRHQFSSGVQDIISDSVALSLSAVSAAVTPIAFFTRDSNRAREISSLLAIQKSKCDVIQVNLPLPEEQGPPQSCLIKKCRAAAARAQGPALIEEKWLLCSAFRDLPGQYSDTFLQKLGAEGLYKMVEPFAQFEAETVSTFAFVSAPGATPVTFEERIKGRLVPPRGFRGFGWESIFEIDDPRYRGTPHFGRTLSELSPEALASVDPQHQALLRLINQLQSVYPQ